MLPFNGGVKGCVAWFQIRLEIRLEIGIATYPRISRFWGTQSHPVISRLNLFVTVYSLSCILRPPPRLPWQPDRAVFTPTSCFSVPTMDGTPLGKDRALPPRVLLWRSESAAPLQLLYPPRQCQHGRLRATTPCSGKCCHPHPHPHPFNHIS